LVNGVEMWVSMWVKRSSKTGEEFFSLALNPKDEARRNMVQRNEQTRVQQEYQNDGYQERRAPPRSAPPQVQRASQPVRNQAPPRQAEEYPDDMSNWEVEP
jgi:hypothetical protein